MSDANADYIAKHPELRKHLDDFLAALLANKPQVNPPMKIHLDSMTSSK